MIVIISGAVMLSVALMMFGALRRSDLLGLNLRNMTRERLEATVLAAGVPKLFRKDWDPAQDQIRLDRAGLGLRPELFLSLRWWSLILAWAAGLLLVQQGRNAFSLGLAGMFMLSALVGPRLWVSHRIMLRSSAIDRSLPDLLDRLSLALDAGLGFEIALRRSIVGFPAPLGEDVERALRWIDHGHSRKAALDRLAAHSDSRDLRAFVASINQADRLGTSLARTLRTQSGLLRGRRKRRAQAASRRLPVLIIFPLVFFFLPALMIVFLAPPILFLLLAR